MNRQRKCKNVKPIHWFKCNDVMCSNVRSEEVSLGTSLTSGHPAQMHCDTSVSLGLSPKMRAIFLAEMTERPKSPLHGNLLHNTGPWYDFTQCVRGEL